MTAPHDLDRQLQAFLTDGPTELPDPSFDAVRDRMETTRQRVVIGPWRFPDMNKLVPIGLGAAALVVALVLGTRLLGPPAPAGPGGAPSASPSPTPSPTPIGGIVDYRLDGLPATTEVDVVADGASVTGTAVTKFKGVQTVRLECAARDGEIWALAGTIEETTVSGERAGDWSAVIVENGSPQGIAIWLSDPKSGGSDCDGWLALIDLADLGAETDFFQPVESGALVPPPDLAP
jgi:hypothetical protein